MNIWIASLSSVLLVSLISLVGLISLSLNRAMLNKVIQFLVSFAVGALFGDAIIHLIPETFKEFGFTLAPSIYIITGILIFFILEKFLLWRHCHAPTSHSHIHPVVTLNFIGDAVHNLLDGVMIAASYMAGFEVGVATTVAVLLHEIPQEIGDFGVFVQGGLSTKKALLLNFLCACSAIFGAIITLILGNMIEGINSYILPITAGGFIYIAGSDLIPELNQTCEKKPSESILQILFIVLGMATMLILVFIE